MTVKELLDEVKSLGFDSHLATDDALRDAANRAATALYTDMPVLKTAKLFARDMRPTANPINLRHKGGGLDRLPLTGKAYTMRLMGSGSYTVISGGSEHTVDFAARGEVFSGFLSGEGEIIFSGALSFYVLDLATFSEVFGENKSDIPDADGRERFSLNELFPNFLAVVSVPKDKNGNEIPDAEISDGKITMPKGFVGEVSITYSTLPDKIRVSEPMREIDMPQTHTALLPLLTAHYAYALDEPELSAQLLASYNAVRANVQGSCYERRVSKYEDTHGWA